MSQKVKSVFCLSLLFIFLASPSHADVEGETKFVLNSFSFLVNGALVMFMSAGFAMLEAGLVRSKNTASICLKNVVIYGLAGLMYFVVGYNLMYVDVSGWIGTFKMFVAPNDAEVALLGGANDPEAIKVVVDSNYASMSDWFFQMAFVATPASIISGTLAERVKIWPFFLFVALLTGFIYPIQGAWIWATGGWLKEMGFKDFAGSTIVHSLGGWAALSGAIILGARKGKYTSDGRVMPMPGANLPLATLGTFILWFGWFAFNGASQLALGSALDVTNMALIFVNTNMAGVAGLLASVVLSQILYKKIDLTFALNGVICGLVSITAGPDLTNPALSLIIGAIGGALAVLTVPLLDRLRIDDVVGAIPAHLCGGIWGTLAVGLFSDKSFLVQLTGVGVVAAFTLLTSSLLWLAIKYTIGLRVDPEHELQGLDQVELGMEAYPEFGSGNKVF